MSIQKLDVEEFLNRSEGFPILDVRSPGEYQHAHIPGACSLPLFSDEEREQFSNLLEEGFIDTFRHFHPHEEERYSWWSYRTAARTRNVGWRIDYFLVSESLEEYLKDADILDQEMGSDHCPVMLELNL